MLTTDWETLKTAYARLRISKKTPFEEMGFMLVGSRILDLNALRALVEDKSLLMIAPKRPSPERPDGQYYFWMLECEPEHLGKYGQEDTDLTWQNWHLLNFGQTLIGDSRNQARADFENQAEALLKSGKFRGPRHLAGL